MIDNHNSEYQVILEKLYEKYYRRSYVKSDVTSSFWDEFGRQHKVEKQNGKWIYFGFGLGSFITDTFRHRIRHFPTVLLSKRLLKRYGCSAELARAGYRVADSSKRLFNFDCAKHVLSLHEIMNQLSINSEASSFRDKNVRVVCTIGDGYHYFSSLLKLIEPELKLISVNLGRSLFFDALFSRKCILGQKPILIEDHTSFERNDKCSIYFLEAENYQLLQRLPIDLFVNITSMQEMNPQVVKNYFNFMRESSSRNVYFYCCNRIEKILPDESVVRFMEYPWKNSIILLDELCPWHQKYPHSGIPLWRKFDGPIQHRFVQLK